MPSAVVPGAVSGIPDPAIPDPAAVVISPVVACGFAVDLAEPSAGAADHCFAGVPVGVPACSTGREVADDPDFVG